VAIKAIFPGARIKFDYENHRGERASRQCVFIGLDYGSNSYYPTDRWLLRGWDISRNDYRSFDLNKIENLEMAWSNQGG